VKSSLKLIDEVREMFANMATAHGVRILRKGTVDKVRKALEQAEDDERPGRVR